MKFLSALFLSLIFNSSLYGFSSVIGNQPRQGFDVHSQITHSILDSMGFSYISFREIVTGNISNDYYNNLVIEASRHCDRNLKISHLDSLKDCRKKFNELFDESLKAVKNSRYLRSLFLLGQSLHIAQDLISHSNLSELTKPQQFEIIDYFLDMKKVSKSYFRKLKLTYWEKDDHKNLKAKDHFSHIEFALDHPEMNVWCKKKMKSGKTKFDNAFELAKKITKLVLDKYLSNLNKNQTAIIKSYNM